MMPICDLDSPWWMLSDYSDTQVRFYARTQAAVNIFWPFASTLRCPSAWETDNGKVPEPRDGFARSPRRPLSNHARAEPAAGRGGGVGRTLGVTPGLGVSVGLAVGVAVTVAVAVGVGVDGW